MDIDWNTKFKDLLVEEAWLSFCLIINQAVNQFIPLGSSIQKKTRRWMNRVANSARTCKSRMWYRYRQSRSYNDFVRDGL